MAIYHFFSRKREECHTRLKIKKIHHKAISYYSNIDYVMIKIFHTDSSLCLHLDLNQQARRATYNSTHSADLAPR